MPYTPYVLPLIAVRGTPFEIGKQYGELARVRILLHLYNQKTLMAQQAPQNPEWWRSKLAACLLCTSNWRHTWWRRCTAFSSTPTIPGRIWHSTSAEQSRT